MKYQAQIVALIEAVEHGADIQREVSIPRATRHIDIVLEMQTPSDAWGIFAPILADRSVLLEHYSRPPTRRQFTNALLKLLYAIELWQRPGELRRRRPPLLFLP